MEEKRAGNRTPVLTRETIADEYESIEFNLANGVSDYDIKANEGAFAAFAVAGDCVIRSSKTITAKINATTNPTITVNARQPFELARKIEVGNLFLTNNSGATAAIKILLFPISEDV